MEECIALLKTPASLAKKMGEPVLGICLLPARVGRFFGVFVG